MLTIVVPGIEMYDERDSSFGTEGDITLNLEHSLVSLSKWESKYEKPFLDKGDKTTEETIGYIKSMTVTRNVPDEVYLRLSEDNIKSVNDYLDAKMTATWFSDSPGAPKSPVTITSELIYYWMVTFNIPFECEKWHLNRLFTLIRVCNNKAAKPTKMSRTEVAERNRQLNEERKKRFNTRG